MRPRRLARPGEALRSAVFLVGVVSLAAASVAGGQSLEDRLLRVEDHRGSSDADRDLLKQGLASSDAALRRRTVRAVGRLERGELMSLVVPLMTDPDASVRAHAYNALAQLARDATLATQVQQHLLDAEPREQDDQAWAALAASLGRLPYGSPEAVQRAEAALTRIWHATSKGLSPSGESASSAEALQRGLAPEGLALGGQGSSRVEGLARGLEALVRISRKVSPPQPSTLNVLHALSGYAVASDEPSAARVRRLAWAGISTLAATNAAALETASTDPDEEVRRLAMLAAAADPALDGRSALLARGLADRNGAVRYEALRGWARHEQARDCAPVLKGIEDANPHVVLLAIDSLAKGCTNGSHAPALDAQLRTLPTRAGDWHRAAHALVAQAAIAPERARAALPQHVDHPIWQVRMYAARAAGALNDTERLRQLVRDPHDNVREAAIDAMASAKSPDLAAAAIDALGRPDYQLVLTAARTLSAIASTLPATQHERARDRALEALERITRERKDTSRDPRMTLLALLEAATGSEQGAASAQAIRLLRALASDFDPAVAAKAAELASKWSGTPVASTPRPLAKPPLTMAALDAIAGAQLRFTIAGRGDFILRLLPDEAPATVLRVVTRAREGYYNGLTFHRVAPNFVIQGGSPGANEYVGDALYMRDEVGLVPHARASVGISTRGRDTGDAQLFVNLVDSPRLDHAYTVFAHVIEGMEVVDRVVEGDVIERVSVIASPPR